MGVKADTFTVRDFSKAIGDIPFSVASAVASMAGLSVGFVEMTKNVLDMTTGLQVFTAETGLNTNALQQWQAAAKEVGLGAEIATNSIMRISQLVAGMRTGHGDVNALSALAALGVRDLSGDAYDIMNRIQAASKGRSPAVAADLLGRLGLSPEMMRVFSISQSEREHIRPTITNNQQQAMAEFTKELAFFNRSVLTEFTKVLVEFEPYMADLTRAMTVIIAGVGGWLAKGIGEDAKLFNTMHDNGVLKTLSDILSSYDTPENLHDKDYVNNFYSTYTIHGAADPNATAAAIAEHHKRAMTNAHKQFNKSGVP